MTAEMLTTARADELGFVNAVVPADELDAAVDAVVERDRRWPPDRPVHDQADAGHAASSPLASALETEAIAQNVNLKSKDIAETFTAFREKRPPEFKGV